jgi:hypothetical protein
MAALTEDEGSPARLTDEQFAEASFLYENGKAGIGDIADRYGVTRQALSQRFKNNGVIKGSKVVGSAAVAQAASATEPDRYADKRPIWIEETKIDGYKAMKQIGLITQKKLIDAARAGSNLSILDDEFKAIGRAAKIVIDTTKGRLDLLDADGYVDEDDLPVLQVEDLTAQEILQHHIDTGAFEEGSTIEDMLAEDALYGKPNIEDLM